MDGCCQWILLSNAPRGVIPNALTRALTKQDADFLELLHFMNVELSDIHISILSDGIHKPRGCPSSTCVMSDM